MIRRILLVLLVALAGCSSDDDDGADTTPSTGGEAPNQNPVGIPQQARDLKPVAEGKLTACIDVQDPPWSFDDNGRITGIDAELVRALGGRLGLQPELRPTKPDALFDDLDDRRCDVVASVSKGDAAATARTASVPYYDVQQALLVRKADAARYPNLAALRGRPVGVQPGTPGVAVAQGEAGVVVTELRDFAQLVAALREGRLDGVVHDFPLVAAAATGAPDERVVTQRFEAVTDQYVLVVPKGADDLKKTIDDALTAIRRDDSYNSIIRRFLGNDAV